MNAPLNERSNSGLPIHVRVREELRAQMTTGNWRPGDMLPPEQQLATDYGVALGTIRKAIETLVGEGLVRRKQGRGTFVARRDMDDAGLRFFHFETRRGIRQAPQAQIFSRTVEVLERDIAQKLQIGVGSRAIKLVRLRTLEGEPVLLDEIWLPEATFKPLLDMPLEELHEFLFPIYAHRCGVDVFRTEEVLTVERVYAARAQALGLSNGSPAIVIERLTFNYADQPVEWRISYGAIERFRYRVSQT